MRQGRLPFQGAPACGKLRSVPEPLVDSSRILPDGAARQAYRLVQPVVEAALGLRAFNAYYEGLRVLGLKAGPFCEAALQHLGVRWEPDEAGLAALRAVQGPCVVVANHPLGGRDAVALCAVLGRARPDFKVLANFIIGQIPEVRDSLILVDPFENRASIAANLRPLREARRYLAQGGLLGLFPAGEVSTWRRDEGRLADKDWSLQSARLIQASKATVLPLRFRGRNRRRFYWAGRVHERLRTLLLPQEVLRGPTRDLQTRLGRPIPFDALPALPAERLAAWLRAQVYAL